MSALFPGSDNLITLPPELPQSMDPDLVDCGYDFDSDDESFESDESVESDDGHIFLYMAPSPPTSFPKWNGLATELKIAILGYCFDDYFLPGEYSIDEDQHAQNLETTFGSLTKAAPNTELAQLTVQTYYETNIFRLTIDSWRVGVLKYPKPNMSCFMRTLRLHVRSCVVGLSLEDMLLPTMSGWRMLLRNKKNLGYENLLHPPPELSRPYLWYQPNSEYGDKLAIKLHGTGRLDISTLRT